MPVNPETNHNAGTPDATPPESALPEKSFEFDLNKISLQEAMERGWVEMEAPANGKNPEATQAKIIDSTEDKPSKKFKWTGKRTAGAVAATAAFAAAAVGIGVSATSYTGPEQQQSTSAPGSNQESANYYEAGSASLGNHFKELSPEKQEIIKKLHDMSLEQFEELHIEEISLYGDWLRRNALDDVSETMANRKQNGLIVLPETVKTALSNTPDEVDAQRARDWFVLGTIVSNHDASSLEANRNDYKKFNFFLHEPSSGVYKDRESDMANLNNQQDPTLMPAIVTNVLDDDPVKGHMEFSVAWDPKINKVGDAYAQFEYQAVRYTDVDGNAQVQWRVETGFEFS